jgi:hypothetical protein
VDMSGERDDRYRERKGGGHAPEMRARRVPDMPCRGVNHPIKNNCHIGLSEQRAKEMAGTHIRS